PTPPFHGSISMFLCSSRTLLTRPLHVSVIFKGPSNPTASQSQSCMTFKDPSNPTIPWFHVSLILQDLPPALTPLSLCPQSIAEYDLKDISYTVKTPTCHELLVLGSLDEPMVFSFEEEREAQKWWTIVSSSLREAQKGRCWGGVWGSALRHSVGEDLALQLALAIQHGDEEAATRCAVALARQQSKSPHDPPLLLTFFASPPPLNQNLPMTPPGTEYLHLPNISEPKSPHDPPRTDLLRPPNPPQVFQDYGFHPLVQRWIIGQCLCVDERTVWSYGVRRDGDPAFLYLLSANRAELTRQPHRQMDLGAISHHLDTMQISDAFNPQTAPAATSLPSPVPAGWSCPKCTFINKPTRPGCEMCSTDRPPDYSWDGWVGRVLEGHRAMG
uniref:SHANK associated RH domain interactor n=1 Tax=Gallus gallus TaxID=9031 RepID=A0A8V0Y6K6_CHICK